jgi:putative transposase
MHQDETLSHAKWDCKYHVVFLPKYRRQVLDAALRQHLGEGFWSLAEQNECRLEEGHLLPDQVHMLMSIPPTYSVSQGRGFIKGKAAIPIARPSMGRHKHVTGQRFWARGDYVTTVGRDEATVRAYIQRQEEEDKRLDQMELW